MKFRALLAETLLLLLSLRLVAQSDSPKLSTLARIDLNASANVALQDGAIVTGSGSVDRQTWLPTNEWLLTYTIQLPIVRFAWNAFAVRFVPNGSGTVRLSLRGPWEEVIPGIGTIYKQEVIWDALEAEGTTVPNSGFEIVSAGTIAGWSGGSSQNATVTVPAVNGSRMARTWHNDSMGCTLDVSAGAPVVLRFYARAVIPVGFQDLKPTDLRDTPAHQAAVKFMRGVNFGNNLELPPESPGRLTYTLADFSQARAEGFDHVRLPVAWQNYAGPAPTFMLADSIFGQVNELVGNALSQGLSVIVDVHNFEAFTSNPPAFADELYALWRQIAAHFSNAPPEVAFEILNEPRDQATTTLMNPIYAEAIRQIRVSNPQRTIFIGPGAFNGIDELNYLILPDGDANLIATVHTYDPFLFTHQGLPWAGADAATAGIRFPGPPTVSIIPAAGMSQWATNWIHDYNTLPTDRNPSSAAAFRGRLQMLRQWSDYYGRPVHVGEFGASATIEAESRLNYYHAKRETLDELGLGWAIWDWKAGFHYFRNGAPDPSGLPGALFPSPELKSQTAGVVEFAGAVGKTFVLERAVTLTPPIRWELVSTQTLATTSFRFSDTEAEGHASAFYRVTWKR